jgi:beta-lactamase class A
MTVGIDNSNSLRRAETMMMNRTIRHFLAAIFFSLLSLAPRVARAGEEGVVRYGLTPQQLQSNFFDGYGDNGYRPVRLTGYRSGDSTRYFTQWVQNTDSRQWRGFFGKTHTEFQNLSSSYRSQGYYPIDVSGYDTPNGVRFAALWERNLNGIQWQMFSNYQRSLMQMLCDTIGQQGWIPHRVEAYASGAESIYVSIWYYQPGVGYRMHNKMTREQYDEHLNEYKDQGYLPVHLDAHTVAGEVFYSGIWKQKNTGWRIRTNRDWRVFQRYYNNNWADGYYIDNFYAAETPNGIRYGGIWFYDGAPVINENSTLKLRLRKEVDSAPARGGAAVLNLATGEEITIHGDQEFAIASTSKIGILYALLKETDLGNKSWAAWIDSGSQYGKNQCDYVQANQEYTAGELAQFMIRCSNNWATNRLIDYIGRNTINQHLSDLGLDVTRIDRYMTGDGAPSAHGNASAAEDRLEGWENLSTPREMVTLLKKVLQDNVLGNTSETRFWNTLKMDPDNDGLNEKNYIAAQVTPMFDPRVNVYNKPGSLTGIRYVKADAGRLSPPIFRGGFTKGPEVLIAIFMDDISDDPDVMDEASEEMVEKAVTAIKNVAREVANQYYQN